MISILARILLRMMKTVITYGLIYKIIMNYKLQVKRNTVIICCLVGYIIQCFLGIVFGEYITLWTIDILCLIIPAYWFGRPKNRNIIMHIYIMICVSIINYFGFCLVQFIILKSNININFQSVYNAENNLTTLTMILIFYLIYGRKHKEYREVYFNKMQSFVFFIGLMLCGLILGGIEYIQRDTTMTEIDVASLCLLVSAISVVFILFGIWYGLLLQKQIIYEVQNEQYESYLKKQEQYMRLIENQDEKLRMFRHDMRAHITAIETFLREKDEKKLEDYIQQMKINSEIYQSKRYTGCTVVDAIIDQYYQMCKKKKIKFDIEGRLPEQFNIQIYDLCIIFSNIISNAVEAAGKVNNGVIHMRIYAYNNHIYINIKNTYNGTLDLQDETFISTKSDNRQHGIGMKNVKNIIHKYDGNINITYDGNNFDLEIIL